jgi:RHS repeat-associated protein
LGNIRNESDFYPWGGELQFANNDSNHYKFTGKERDAETGLDYFGARYYSNGLGRFITPDWAAKATAVPYADFGNPQSLNLYRYPSNPETYADIDGHQDAAELNMNRDVRDLAAGRMTKEEFQARLNARGAGAAIGCVVGCSIVGGPTALAAGRGLLGLALVTAPKTVPIATDIIEGATPGAPGPKLSSAEQLAVNKATGKAFEQMVVDATKATDTKVAEQVTLKTESGVKTRMDVVSTKPSGDVRLREAKGSATASLTEKQTAAHPEIEQTGATVVGKGKPDYPGGTKIPPTKVEVVRPDKE